MIRTVIRTDRTEVRSWSHDDAPALVALADNRRVADQLRDRFPHPYTPADARRWLDAQTGAAIETNFAIDADGRLVGAIGLTLGDDVDRGTAEIGYWLGEPFWGRGLMSEVVPPFTAWAFAAFGLERIEAGVFEGNLASERVLQKAGFVLEGRLRSAITKGDRVLDRLLYAKLKADVGSGRGAVR